MSATIVQKCSYFISVVIELVYNFLNIRRKCESKRRLDGRVVVITGANTGIGKETAFQLSLRGAKIYIGCRSVDKAKVTINEIRAKNPKANITSLKLDLSSLKSVREFANQLKSKERVIDILVNNAGIMQCPEWKTEDGFEMQFGTNYLGPFLLTMLLLPCLKKSSDARIISISSVVHMIGYINFHNINLKDGVYTPMGAYAQSKLAQIIFTRELSRKLSRHTNVKTYALHPGIIDSELHKHSYVNPISRKLLFISPQMGCQTTLYCALDEDLTYESGHYYDDCKRVDRLMSAATDREIARRLWQMSCGLVELESEFKI